MVAMLIAFPKGRWECRGLIYENSFASSSTEVSIDVLNGRESDSYEISEGS